jgi:HD-GYP domain-containing protein (c-di-GMP phosphodiesterase class II)
MLRKIDRLRLPLASRRDIESILVQQVSKEIDRAIPWQAGHGRRTAAVSLLIGQVVDLTPCELHDLKLAAFLHDIGLLMLPAHLTEGTDPLELESYVAIQNHSRLGAALLEPFSFLKEASILIAHHHERWDGSGYPFGIRGQFIPLGARILSRPTPSMPYVSPESRTVLRETTSHSELCESQPAPNSTRN